MDKAGKKRDDVHHVRFLDGLNWAQLGQSDGEHGAERYVGLAVSSRTTSSLASRFDNVFVIYGCTPIAEFFRLGLASSLTIVQGAAGTARSRSLR